MTKKSKLLAGLMAAVVALSVMAFGFSQWTTDINLNGSVSAKGSWDVKVTGAAVKTSSTGAAADLFEPTTEATVYDFYSYWVPSTSYTCYEIDDTSAATVSLTKAALNDYNIGMSIATKWTSNGQSSALYTGKVKLDADAEGYYQLNNTSLKTFKNTTDKTERRKIGSIILVTDLKSKFNKLEVQPSVDWKKTNDALASAAPSSATFTDTEVNYAPVAFSLPGAWAEYSVTITNNGTANANLSDYKFDVSTLDEIYAVDTPSLNGDVLKPGESCTFTFVVKVDESKAGSSFDVDAQSFKVTLTYNQDAVEDAPAASHSH